VFTSIELKSAMLQGTWFTTKLVLRPLQHLPKHDTVDQSNFLFKTQRLKQRPCPAATLAPEKERNNKSKTQTWDIASGSAAAAEVVVLGSRHLSTCRKMAQMFDQRRQIALLKGSG